MQENQDNSNNTEVTKEPSIRTIKFYELNNLVNLRLTAKRSDILTVLNQKKQQGIDISDYLTSLIRKAEGLPEPEEGENPFPVLPTVAPVTSLSDELMDKLVERIMGKLATKGVQMGTMSSDDSSTEDEESQSEEIKNELKNIAADMMDWED